MELLSEMNFTIETRLSLSEGNIDYFITNIAKQERLFRIVWKLNESGRWSKQSKLNSYIQGTYKVDKRTANTLIKGVKGRKKALTELKNIELSDLKTKEDSLVNKVKKLKVKINEIKPKVASNKATDKELANYRRNKKRLFYKQQKLERIRHKIANLENNIQYQKFSICWGTKRLFNAQHWLRENNFRSKIGWLNTYRKQRDNQVNYIGSIGEPCCNQNCQLSYDAAANSFQLRIRKDLELMGHENDKFFTLTGLNFKYQRDKLIELLGGQDTPITIRIKREGTKWYLQIIITWINDPKQIVTNTLGGTIGLDFNSGFIQMAETDKYGNLTNLKKYPLLYHGAGNSAESEIREVVSEITDYATTKGKSIVIEDLNFKRKKAQASKAIGKQGKKYNSMLHAFDYSRYGETIKNAAHRNKVGLIQVNPAYTTKIGIFKYNDRMKLNPHQGAAYVIARKGMGYIDRLKKRPKVKLTK